MKKLPNKIIVFVLILLLALGFAGVGKTSAYYSDTETSSDNLFAASMLDFDLFNTSFSSLIGPEAVGEKTYASVAMPVVGSLPMQYNLSASITNDLDGLCGDLTVEAKQNGVVEYSGPLSGLAGATSTDFGSWEFRFDLPVAASVGHGEVCNMDAVFSAWRADTPLPADSGFTDEERTSFSFTARMVVLNEIFARPNGGVAPKDREYIELYNNGSTPVDVLGWQISEIAGVTETFYPIVASGAVSGEVMPYNGASTVIPPGGFLVLEFGGASSHLNDGGDTVKLYDGGAILLDSHAYPAVPAGKAVVRFPDGIGFWVDPEPTPGSTNMVSMEDLILAGFDDETIAQILELAALKNVTLLEDETEEVVVADEEATEEDADTLPEDEGVTEDAEVVETGGGGVVSPDTEEVDAEEVLPSTEETETTEVVEETEVSEPASTPEPLPVMDEPAILPEPEPVAEVIDTTPTEVIEPSPLPEPALVAEPAPEAVVS